MYTMKNVTEKLGMTVHTVRHYTDMCLVPTLSHNKNGNRLFDEAAVNWLMAAGFLRASGMTIAEIKHYFDLCQIGDGTIEERYQILQALKQRTEKELIEVQERLHCISEKVDHCQKIIAGNMVDDCNPMNW